MIISMFLCFMLHLQSCWSERTVSLNRSSYLNSRCFHIVDLSVLPSIDPNEEWCLRFSLWAREHPRIRRYWSASQPICCQKHLACSLSVSLAKENRGGGHFSWMPLPWSERENASQIERERERESTDYQWEPLSGRQHKLVWGKFKNRRQQAETVSPLCSFDLPLTWVHLKPGRDTSTAVWCVLRHWAAKTARCASRCNLI